MAFFRAANRTTSGTFPFTPDNGGDGFGVNEIKWVYNLQVMSSTVTRDNVLYKQLRALRIYRKQRNRQFFLNVSDDREIIPVPLILPR